MPHPDRGFRASFLSAPDPATLSPLVPTAVTRWHKSHDQPQPEPRSDEVAAEVPVALVFNGISHAVMMATPADLAAMAVGFALTEGIVEHPSELRDLEVQTPLDCLAQQACSVHLEISPERFHRLKDRRRTLEGRTGCGVCGIDSLQALDLHPPAMPTPDWLATVDAAAVFRAFEGLAAQQPLNARVGSLHAAGWVSPEGQLHRVREDVGRHNALDKLVGQLALDGRLGEPGFVVITSRTSFELVRKCARMSIPLLATISAPTSLAVQLAQESRMQLWGLCRPTHAQRYV